MSYIYDSKNISVGFQLSNRLGSAKCAADLVLPSAVARSGEQAITIEGSKSGFIHTVLLFLDVLWFLLSRKCFECSFSNAK